MAYITHQARRFPAFDLHGLTIDPRLVPDPRDAALAHRIVEQVTSRWITLQTVIRQYLQLDWPGVQPELKAALLCASAQILLLDRVPAYAAVDHAVQWCKLHIRAGAGKLANAVLRRIAELPIEGEPVPYASALDELPLSRGGALRLRKPIFPRDPHPLLSTATSHPLLLIERWASRNDEDTLIDLAMHSLCDAPIILNTMYAAKPLPAGITPHAQKGHYVFAGTHNDLVLMLDARRDLWVQDPASAKAITLADDRNPALVIDLCAGQGTKTRQLAAAFPRAMIIATDPDPRRFVALQRFFDGHPRVRVQAHEALLREHRGQADLVLLDVPCSNSGVFARRPEAKYRLDDAHLASLVTLQRKIIEQGASLLAPTPRSALLYSTCSLEPQENMEQVDWAVQTLSFTKVRHHMQLPQGGPGRPAMSYTDGSFAALLAASTPG